MGTIRFGGRSVLVEYLNSNTANSLEWYEWYVLMARDMYEQGREDASWANLFFAVWER